MRLKKAKEMYKNEYIAYEIKGRTNIKENPEINILFHTNNINIFDREISKLKDKEIHITYGSELFKDFTTVLAYC